MLNSRVYILYIYWHRPLIHVIELISHSTCWFSTANNSTLIRCGDLCVDGFILWYNVIARTWWEVNRLFQSCVDVLDNTPVTPGWRPYCASTATENGFRARQGRHKRGINVVETPDIVLWSPWSPMIAESRRLFWACSKQTPRFGDLTWNAVRTRWGREGREPSVVASP